MRNSGSIEAPPCTAGHVRIVLLVSAFWQAVCAIQHYVYGFFVWRAVLAAYTSLLGDVQASIGCYQRLDAYIAYVVMTAPATLAAIFVLCRFYDHRPKRKAVSAMFLLWEIPVLALLAWKYETGLHYMINQLKWTLFGPPDDLYSVRNLGLPRLLAWLLCTLPVCIAVTWYCSRRLAGRARGFPVELIRP